MSETKRVIIEVSGGVVSVAEKPDDVEVIIRDWDDIDDILVTSHSILYKQRQVPEWGN